MEQDLPGVTSIDSILGQCTYFGLSFGRVGVDFTGRISDIFVRVIGERFEQDIRRTTRKFEKDMETFTLINKTQRLDIKTETAIISVSVKIKLCTSFARKIYYIYNYNFVSYQENPPEQLVEFYPLAEYCNGIIIAFNELRLCAPVALSTLCTKLLQESLRNVARAMLIFYKQEQQVSCLVIFVHKINYVFLKNVCLAGFCSNGTGEHDQIYGMFERTIDSLYTILYTLDLSTRPNCNAFRNIGQYTPERGMYQ